MILLYIWLGFIISTILANIINKFCDDEDVAIGFICFSFVVSIMLSLIYIILLMIKSVFNL